MHVGHLRSRKLSLLSMHSRQKVWPQLVTHTSLSWRAHSGHLSLERIRLISSCSMLSVVPPPTNFSCSRWSLRLASAASSALRSARSRYSSACPCACARSVELRACAAAASSACPSLAACVRLKSVCSRRIFSSCALSPRNSSPRLSTSAVSECTCASSCPTASRCCSATRSACVTLSSRAVRSSRNAVATCAALARSSNNCEQSASLDSACACSVPSASCPSS
mmetsp:Transcript_20891/g.52973  ORF Transcript_20891/g.52973 Transcript_20891/m.52973 type:complete len:224 (+) Transcript_20891:189-860(+)